MKLTEHFQLSEFVDSPTAYRLGIDNTPSVQVITNLQNLCEQVLEPLRLNFNTPIIISSGYRCPKLNSAVGGVSNSQHMKGEAADIHIPSKPEGRKYIEFILDQTCFDQVIWEHDKHGNYWIHVSCKLSNNRQTYIPNLLKK